MTLQVHAGGRANARAAGFSFASKEQPMLHMTLNVTTTTAKALATAVVETDSLTASEKATAIRNLLLAAKDLEAKRIIRKVGREFV
jgi:hypothetical protein